MEELVNEHFKTLLRGKTWVDLDDFVIRPIQPASPVTA